MHPDLEHQKKQNMLKHGLKMARLLQNGIKTASDAASDALIGFKMSLIVVKMASKCHQIISQIISQMAS